MNSVTRLRVILVLIFAAGMLLVAAPWHDWLHAPDGAPLLAPWAHKLIEGLGEALAIAAILGWTVDAAAKRELVEEVLENVSAHIAGHLLQPQLRDVIVQYLEADLVRTSWDITYTFDDWPDQPADTEYRRLTTKFDYQMENRSKTVQYYDCVFEMEKSLFPHIGDASIVTMTGKTLVGPPDGFASKDHPQGFYETPTNLGFRKTVTIPPHNGPAYAIHGESEELVRDGSILPFYAKYPVLRTTLAVEYPADRMDVVVELSLGPLDPSEVGTPLPAGRGWKWEFARPMLPGQGFTVRFARKQAATAMLQNAEEPQETQA